MKSALLVCFSFLLFAFVFSKPSIAADNEPVLDIQGEELKAGTEYIITSLIWGAGGGDVSATNKTCPDDVIQYFSNLLPGLPVTFSPAYSSSEDVIRVSTELNIKFSTKETCDQSPVWKIQKSTNPEIQWFVTTGGVEGNPGNDTIANWFKIEKAGIGYKLVYCPKDICSCEVLCRHIGIFSEKGKENGILSLSDALSPFLVVFRKVGSSCSSI